MNQNKKGFTLIELLVVIAIIALLLSILIPSLQHAKKMAQGTVCLSNLRTLSIAWHLYALENDGMMVGGHTATPGPPLYSWVEGGELGGGIETVEDKKENIMKGALYPYVKNPEAYHCPGDQRYKHPPEIPGYVTGVGGYRSYSIAAGMNAIDPVLWDWIVDGRSFIAHKKLDRVKSPSSKYVFVEESDGRGWNFGEWVVSPLGTSFEDYWTDPIAIWHNDRSTLGFADGHAEVHRWVDQSTIDMAERQETGVYAPDSEDLRYMQRGFSFEGWAD